jgi:transcriptional regulator with XRE-family HTH domain
MAYADKDKEAKVYFGNVLKNAMGVCNLSQKELSELIGTPFWRVSDMTRGNAMPTDKQFDEICSLLNVSEGSFFPNGKIKLPSEKDYQANRQRKIEHNKKKLNEKSIGKPREEEKGITLDVEGEVAMDKIELGETQTKEQYSRDYESKLQQKDNEIAELRYQIDELKCKVTKEFRPVSTEEQKVKSVSIDVPVGDKVMKIMVTVE